MKILIIAALSAAAIAGAAPEVKNLPPQKPSFRLIAPTPVPASPKIFKDTDDAFWRRVESQIGADRTNAAVFALFGEWEAFQYFDGRADALEDLVKTVKVKP